MAQDNTLTARGNNTVFPLAAIATAAAPSLTEGTMAAGSMDLSGNLRTIVTGTVKAAGTETTVTPAAVALSANTNATLLAANANRIRFIVSNPLATSLFVRKSASATTASAGGYDFAVPPGGTYISDPYEYLGQLTCLCATAGSVGISESV